MEYQKRCIQNTFNRIVKRRNFEVGNLVLRKALEKKVESEVGKLVAMWEGPYKVIEIMSVGDNILVNLDGNEEDLN